MDIGLLIMYMYMQRTNFEGGDSHEGGGRRGRGEIAMRGGGGKRGRPLVLRRKNFDIQKWLYLLSSSSCMSPSSRASPSTASAAISVITNQKFDATCT